MIEFLRKTYRSIDDLPVYNWNKLVDGELQYLYLTPHKYKRVNESRLTELWETIYNEWFVEFGLTDSMKDYLNKRKEIAKMQLDVILKGDRKLLTHIEIAKEELNETPKGKIDFMQTIVSLEKFLGFSIDVNVCSVRKYNQYILSYNGR